MDQLGKNLNLSARPTTSSRESSGSDRQLRLKLAAERTRLLFGCFRKGDANDPEIYTAAVAAVLSEYEPDVIVRVTDPRTGLPRKTKFLPNPAEVAEACEEATKAVAAERVIAKAGWFWNGERWENSNAHT